MTKTNILTKSYKTLHIPSRQEFHRYASNLISQEDFSTVHPNNAVSRTFNAIHWTIGHSKKY